MLKNALPRLQRFAAARLSPEGEVGLHLTIGVVLLVLAACAFGAVAEEVVEGAPITMLDVALANLLHAHAHNGDGLTRVMLLISTWHGVAGMLAMVALLAYWLYRRGDHYWLLALLFAVPGGMLLNVLMKFSFRRPRPHFDSPLVTLSTYSFPSGHTVAATLFYGFLALYLTRHAHSWRQRAVAALLACVMVALVAASRMYLGAHYLTDILAAVAEGCAWLAVCITAVSTLRRRREARGQPLWRAS
jgi:membrane-associated phospholipid phosphatase